MFSYKLRYIVGFWLVEMVISTNPKPTIYHSLYENTSPLLNPLSSDVDYKQVSSIVDYSSVIFISTIS